MRTLFIDIGGPSLELDVADDAELDDRFQGTCRITGEALAVNGWLIDSIEEA